MNKPADFVVPWIILDMMIFAYFGQSIRGAEKQYDILFECQSKRFRPLPTLSFQPVVALEYSSLPCSFVDLPIQNVPNATGQPGFRNL